jgi:hypothetical protein
MPWTIRAWVDLHAHRFAVGMNSLISAIGGIVTFVVTALTLIVGGASKEVWILIVTFFISLSLVIYDCGRRILEAETRLSQKSIKIDLAGCLSLLEQRIHIIERMGREELKTFPTAGFDPSTRAILEGTEEILRRNGRADEAILFTSRTNFKPTPMSLSSASDHEVSARQRALDYLSLFAKQLKEIILRLP